MNLSNSLFTISTERSLMHLKSGHKAGFLTLLVLAFHQELQGAQAKFKETTLWFAPNHS